MFFTSWPYLLLHFLTDDSDGEQWEAPFADARELVEHFFALDDCCLDRGISLKVKQVAGSPRALLGHRALRAAFKLWSRTARVGNMATERQLNLITRASPKRCFVERLISAGFLALIKSRHSKANGRDPSVMTRQQLRDADIPIRAKHRHSAQAKRIMRERARAALVMHRNAEVSRHHGVRLGFRDWSNYKINKLGKSDRAKYRERMEQLQDRWDSHDLLSDVSDGSDVETASVAYDKKIGRQLWGCSSLEEPIRANVLAEVLQDQFGDCDYCTGN